MADDGPDVIVGELVSDGVVGHEDAAGHDGCGQGAGGVRGSGEPRSRFEGVEAKVFYWARFLVGDRSVLLLTIVG